MPTLSAESQREILDLLKTRFEKNAARNKGISWNEIQSKLEANPEKIWSLSEMERTGGEPDFTGFDEEKQQLTFMDCAPESPKERRSLCFDEKALDDRKEHKPQGSAEKMAGEMGVEILNEAQYRYLQTLAKFDLKTSSWIATPASIRKLGGALFGDRRYDQVFAYHNGASSYYAARGFRAILIV